MFPFSLSIMDMLILWRFIRMVSREWKESVLMVGFVISGGQDKLIYVHRPGDSQPSHVLVGHENNVSSYYGDE